MTADLCCDCDINYWTNGIWVPTKYEFSNIPFASASAFFLQIAFSRLGPLCSYLIFDPTGNYHHNRRNSFRDRCSSADEAADQ
ncbi:hypothetical protein SDJN02_07278, partial [Cucurbita argyrosperma subsp. argyrosperma]